MAKEICCYCKDGWTPISTSVGGAHVGVIPGEYSNPPMVNVIGGGRLHLHCTFERWPRGWRMQTPGSYSRGRAKAAAGTGSRAAGDSLELGG
jgi:hypothetical protein